MNDLILSLEQAISQASTTECPSLLGELERLKWMAWAKIINNQATLTVPSVVVDNGRYLTVEEVTARFKVSDRWVYRHKKQMPHSQPSRKVLLFPEQAITRWFASRKGARQGL